MIQRSFNLIKKKKESGIEKVVESQRIKRRFVKKVGKKKGKLLFIFFLQRLEKKNKFLGGKFIFFFNRN